MSTPTSICPNQSNDLWGGTKSLPEEANIKYAQLAMTSTLQHRILCTYISTIIVVICHDYKLIYSFFEALS